MKTVERFLRYIKVHTTSDPACESAPSSAIQFNLAHILVEEMKEIGIENAHVDEFGVVYGFIPATPGCEDRDALGFIAHMDTSPDFSGENVKPQIIENYDGGDVLLAGSGDVLSVAAFPTLSKLVGQTLITTDGTTLLGGDDKAGIAEIMTAAESLIASGAPHGKVCIAFTPDEEVGAGVDHFDVEKFGAKFAYTVDGGYDGEIAYETFNACDVHVAIHGLSVHPGSAKDTMINAALVGMQFNALLPENEIPRETQDYQGFYHLHEMKGDCSEAELHYIVRDHNRELFEQRKETMREAARTINARYGREVVVLTIRDSYFNMAEAITPHMHLIDNAFEACKKVGMTPYTEPIRGGTDGSRLSFMGLPTPNLCTGGFACHGKFEHITMQSLERCAKMVENLMTI